MNGTDTVGEWNCTVGEGEGEGISCSDAIYNSPESWRATQQRLEQEIRKLKAQLDKLKVTAATYNTYTHPFIIVFQLSSNLETYPHFKPDLVVFSLIK